MKKILLTCYAVNPYKGSEDGTGWNMICQVARYHKAIAITRENNREAIEKYLAENEFPGKENLQFLYFDWPWYFRFWKRKNKGALLYFYLWQMTIVGFIKKQKIDFDIVHNLNFHSDWTPTFLWRLSKPLVWGPIGHHPAYPASYYKSFYGTSGFFRSQIRCWAKSLFWKGDPFLWLAKKSAAKIIGINSTVSKVLSLEKKSVVILPAVGAKAPLHRSSPESTKFEILSIGRFVPLKGFDLTLKAFAKFYHRLPEKQQGKVQLNLVGKGPCKKKFQVLIEQEKIKNAVRLIPWMEQSALAAIYEQAAVFCFPSHEGAGMVVPEALAHSLPIICLDNSGPGEFIDESCGRKIAYGRYEDTITELAEALHQLYVDQQLRKELAKGARQHFEKYFTWNRKGDLFREIYEEVLYKKEAPKVNQLF